MAAAAAAAAGTAVAPISPKVSMFATAAVAKREVDSLFETAALKLSVAPPSMAAAAAAAAKAAGGGKEKSPTGVGKGATLAAEVARNSKPKAAAAAAVERLLPFGAEVTTGVTSRDIVEAVSSRSWVSGAAEEGPRGALTGVLATAQVLMEKVKQNPLFLLSRVVEHKGAIASCMVGLGCPM